MVVATTLALGTHLVGRLPGTTPLRNAFADGAGSVEVVLGRPLPEDGWARGLTRFLVDGVVDLVELGGGELRREQRGVRVDDSLDDHGTVGGAGLLPGRADLVGFLDADAGEAEYLGVPRVREVGDTLRGVVPRIAFHLALFPGDLVEVAVVEYDNAKARVGPVPPAVG